MGNGQEKAGCVRQEMIELAATIADCKLPIASHGMAIVAVAENFVMNGKYVAAAAGTVIAGFATWYFWGRKRSVQPSLPQKENERHHLTNAFAKAKQVAVGR